MKEFLWHFHTRDIELLVLPPMQQKFLVNQMENLHNQKAVYIKKKDEKKEIEREKKTKKKTKINKK